MCGYVPTGQAPLDVSMTAPQLIAVLAGLAGGTVSIRLARRVQGENWLYAATVILLPVIYLGFAMSTGDASVVAAELLLGIPFVGIAIVCLRWRTPRTALLVGALWVAHAVVDVFHDLVFVNPGVPDWYPFFCAAIDLLIGASVCTARWPENRLRTGPFWATRPPPA